MALFSILAKIGLDKTGFDAGIDAASKRVGKFGGELKNTLAGAFTIAAITAFVRSVADTAGRIKDLSEQFGISTTEVQELDFALKQGGLAFEDISAAMNSMSRARRDAVEGNIELRETFGKFGVSLATLNSSSVRTIDILRMLASSQAAQNMTAREQSDLMDLLGPKALRMFNVLKDLEKLKPPAMFTSDQIAKVDEATKALQRYNDVAKITAAGFAVNTERFFSGIAKGFSAIKGGALPGKAWGKFATEMLGMDEAIADAMKPMNGIASDLLGKVFGVPKKKDDLWDVDANVREKKADDVARVSGVSARQIQSDQFQRIGAFTGAAAEAAQVELLRRNLTALEKIRDDLIRRGIKVDTSK